MKGFARCSLLADEGFLVREAEDGEDGLEQIVEFHPDVVLCDLMLPGLDGLSLWGKARELGSDAGFIMMTGAEKSTDGSCIPKPLDLTTVPEAVGRLLEQPVEATRTALRLAETPD